MDHFFTQSGQEDYLFWKKNDHATLKKINKLINAIKKDPFKGIGKPEALKHDLSGKWSRQINRKDRIVYEIKDTSVLVIHQCRYHYKNK